jgi:hypothetical protein
MTDRKATKPRVETLELNKETVQELTASEAEAVAGGKPKAPPKSGNNRCGTGHTCTCGVCGSIFCNTEQQFCPGPERV